MVTIRQKLASADSIIKEVRLMRTIQKKHLTAVWEKDFIRTDEFLAQKKVAELRVDNLLKEY